MEPQDPIAKLEYWKEHLKKLAEFDGSQTLYADQNGISASKLSYYKYKLGPKPKPDVKPGFTKVVAEKVTAEKPALPDPRWMAEFIAAFLQAKR